MACIFEIYSLQDRDGREHSALRIPRMLPGPHGCEKVLPVNDVFNLIMIDGSEHMRDKWSHLVSAWNENIADKLEGRTTLYTFGDLVQLKRTQSNLKQEDLERNQRRNFTLSIRVIRQMVKNSKEKHIRIFIIINGPHNADEQFPEEEIDQLASNTGKTVVVYILGIGNEFPSQHCLEILAKLSSGNQNDVTFYKAEDVNGIEEQCSKLGNVLKPFVAKLELSKEAHMLPGSPKKTTLVHLGDWVYFEEPISELKPLSLKVNENTEIDIAGKMVNGNKNSALLDLFFQWNKILLQEMCKECVPDKVFDRMDSFYSDSKSKYFKNLPKHEREKRKTFLSLENQFRQCINKKKNQNKGQEINEDLKLADLYLVTKVFDSDVKTIKWKYCNTEKFRKFMDSFKTLYEKNKPMIMALPPPHPHECCRITQSSTLSHLMEDDFENIFQKEKFDFLKSFTMSGIPIFTLRSSAAQKNPWAMRIKHILVEPYSVMSQQALEGCATYREDCLDWVHMAVQVEPGKEETKFNAIVPIVPARAANVLKPIVQSDLYAKMATLCILKNPTTVDFSAHFAALGCVWLETLKQCPEKWRPEFISTRLNDIETTAKLYLDKNRVTDYRNVLLENPKEALMFESSLRINGRSIRCESLMKPVFLLYLMKDSLSKETVAKTFRHIVFEFIRRCLIRKGRCSLGDTPFTDFFCLTLSGLDQRKKWIEGCCKEIIEKKKHNYKELVDKFYTLQDLRNAIQRDTSSGLATRIKKLICNLTFGIFMKKVNSLRNIYSCGGIMWSTFEILARELDLPANPADSDSALLYVTAVLNDKEAKKHLPDVPQSPDEALAIVKERIPKEILASLRKGPTRKWNFEKEIMEEWKNKLRKVHNTLAHPMTQQQIVAEAQERGIEVKQETFHEVYEYDECTKLLRNACQIRRCPHYLKPCKNFNQHLSQAKTLAHFPESLHWITSRFKHHGPEYIKQELISKKRNPHGGHRKSRLRTHEVPSVSEDIIKELIAMYEHSEKS